MESRWRWLIGLLLAIIGIGVAGWRGWIELLSAWIRSGVNWAVSQQLSAWTLSLPLLAVLAVLAIARVRRLRPRRASAGVFWVGGGPYVDHGSGEWDGVRWRLRLPDLAHSLRMPEPSEVADSLRIDGPFCPKCGTELEERERFLGGYAWTCPRGDFAQRRKASRYVTRDRALRIFQREVEKQARAELERKAGS